MKRFAIVAVCVALAACSKKSAPPAPEFSFTPFDYPGARETQPAGIAGKIIFGTYLDSTGTLRAFIHDMPSAKFTTLDEPPNLIFPIPMAIFGDTLVGFVNSGSGFHGFFYDIPSQKYTIFDHPNAGKNEFAQHHTPGTFLSGIAAATFCGYYVDDAGAAHGFLADRQTKTLTPINHPAGSATFVTSFSGDTVIGYYTQHDSSHGFLYDLASKKFTPLDAPAPYDNTQPAAISGNTVVGSFSAGSIHHGFHYDIATKEFTTVDHPGTQPPHSATPASGYTIEIVGETFLTGISGPSLIGYYTTPAGVKHGFIANRR